ncbi:hypothetical protein PoB_007688900 [Plakobranchus ocellatus]|uniref:Uncharacterized protein n=1 Tax=Plakobranchus ocellatus TaxID=259542 RepID=A0AAV4E294_9GAST|nr:hypothetical protein PoB_007688900 [Plakobranchus ocellatus]
MVSETLEMNQLPNGCGTRTRDRRVPADLREDSLATEPPTAQKKKKKKKKKMMMIRRRRRRIAVKGLKFTSAGSFLSWDRAHHQGQAR